MGRQVEGLPTDPQPTADCPTEFYAGALSLCQAWAEERHPCQVRKPGPRARAPLQCIRTTRPPMAGWSCYILRRGKEFKSMPLSERIPLQPSSSPG